MDIVIRRDGHPGSLSHLSSENTHVHGVLRILVSGRVLPSLGYFGPDDVCFNDWVRELASASRTLMASDPASFVFDEGEQGQPAFHFERSGDDVLVSVRDSLLSGADGDPAWERIPCRLDDFVGAVSRFLEQFREALSAQAGSERARMWWQQLADPPNSSPEADRKEKSAIRVGRERRI